MFQQCFDDIVMTIFCGGYIKTNISINAITGEKTFYYKDNSGLPINYVYSLAIDGSGNKWIGTYGGVGIYNENGVYDIFESIIKDENYINIYPNPVNDFVNINSAGQNTLRIYDILGSQVLETQFENEIKIKSYLILMKIV